MIALIDCNNFYASCERIFNPSLIGKPIAVLSSNDGCIVARSQEVKNLGIPVGAPYHKWENTIKLHDVQCFSANFTLYGDISGRVMQVLTQFSPEVEIYSIDEAFIFLQEVKTDDYRTSGVEIKRRVNQWTGADISVGIAPTKTLAKLANKYAKKNENTKGVFVVVDPHDPKWANFFKKLPVVDVWGIGYNLALRLNKKGIYSVADFMALDPIFVRKLMGVTGLRTYTELHGTPCLQREDNRERHKSIISSRTFRRPVTTFDALRESVATFTARAAEKLRKDKSAAGVVHVGIRTNKHRTDKPQYFGYDHQALPSATGYTPDLIHAAVTALKRMYKPDYAYKKSMVTLTAIVPQDQVQYNLFENKQPVEKYENVMKAVDMINKEHGSRTINFGAMGTFQPWKPKAELRSPRYTTSWEELFTVRV